MMVNPEASLDINGEWIEIFNTTGSAIDMNGWTLTDESANTHIINNGGPLLVPSNGFLVLGRNADPLVNGGVIVDYQYSDITLSNDGNTINLTSPGLSGVIIDSVLYDSSFNVNGSSASLDPSAFDHVLNDNLSNWCPSTTVFGAGDTGTPGVANDSCF